jgi:PAS domain S-box-containing protein
MIAAMGDRDSTQSARAAGGAQRTVDIRHSEERFRLLVEAVRDHAIFMLDPDGYVVSWNTGAQNIKGYAADEIIGQHFSRFYPTESIQRGWPEHELRVAARDGRFEDQGWRVRKDGSRFWANVVITAMYDEAGGLRGFAKVTRDMTERRRIEELEDAARRMNEFLAMLAHELRNPLAPIRNALSIMELRELGEDPSVHWARDVIVRQMGHLTRLVDDLIDVSRVTSGKITLRVEKLNLASVVERAAEASQPLINERMHTLEVLLPAHAILAEGDATRLVQVVTNLLHNAAKYTPEGGRIVLALEREEERAVIRVRDNGIGMTPEFIRRAFDLFVQGEQTLARSEGGLGVGLSLVRSLVEMHRGVVEAHSAGPGLGSEFVVRLPLQAVATLRVAREPSQQRATGACRRRILVVDDNRDAANTMVKLMQLWGHEARSAFDGASALALAQEIQPEIVLLDIGLPGIDGFEVAERMRALPGLDRVLLVALTGYGQSEDRRRSHAAGIDHHLVKPVDPAALQRLIATAPAPET